jgi:hypothetical protein
MSKFFDTSFNQTTEVYPVGKFNRRDFHQKMSRGGIWIHKDGARILLNTSIEMYRLTPDFFRAMVNEQLIVKDSIPMNNEIDIYVIPERKCK